MDVSATTNGHAFAQLHLCEPLVHAISEIGYEVPTPIQLQTIPLLLAGQDVIGQAQTGTGKTAAFALPILQHLDLGQPVVQALILTPTRELAIQVAEAIHTYAKWLGRVYVLPIYGGDSMQKQIGQLRRGMQVIVGTPGRIMDHLRRGTLDFAALKTVVLDEADEMLRMGFLEDVEWILSQAPAALQIALFSATMPQEIRRIAKRYLKHPATVEIQHKTRTVPLVAQHYINVLERQKLDVLAHVLEVEATPGEAMLIFTRTRVGAAALAEQLEARGYVAEAIHGDMSQAQREAVMRRLRGGHVELVVATDVAARGLDVERISRVINYDMPNDTDAYVHRIGRTGRAGRAGKTILFVTPREQRMRSEIERSIRQPITPMQVPTAADVMARRMALFKERILQLLGEGELDLYLALVAELVEESGCDLAQIAAAAMRLAAGEKPLLAALEPEPAQVTHTEDGMVRFFIDVGRKSGVRPADIVGAIANEAGVPGEAIGVIDIYDRFTFVDVPAQYQKQVLTRMTSTTIRSRDAHIRMVTPQPASPIAAKPAKPKKKVLQRKNGKTSAPRKPGSRR